MHYFSSWEAAILSVSTKNNDLWQRFRTRKSANHGPLARLRNLRNSKQSVAVIHPHRDCAYFGTSQRSLFFSLADRKNRGLLTSLFLVYLLHNFNAGKTTVMKETPLSFGKQQMLSNLNCYPTSNPGESTEMRRQKDDLTRWYFRRFWAQHKSVFW